MISNTFISVCIETVVFSNIIFDEVQTTNKTFLYISDSRQFEILDDTKLLLVGPRKPFSSFLKKFVIPKYILKLCRYRQVSCTILIRGNRIVDVELTQSIKNKW